MTKITSEITRAAAVVAVFAASCGTPSRKTTGPGDLPAVGAPDAAIVTPVDETTMQAVGLDEAALDRSVAPCDDFYQFACGSWLKNTPIPADRPYYGRSFEVIEERNEQILKELLAAATGPVGTFYAACMDEAALEQSGTKPIDGLLKLAHGVKDKRTLTAAVIALHQVRAWALFDISAAQDFKNATQTVAFLDQNGLGLPEKDYYFRDDEDARKLRASYVAHVERMLALAGAKPADAKRGAADVMTMETALAQLSAGVVERRDLNTLYHPMDRAALAKLAPTFGWDEYFKALGHAELETLIVTNPAFFTGFDAMLTAVKPAVWRSYLVWTVLRATGDLLSKKFVDERFAFRQLVSGEQELPPRWKQCVRATDDALGEALGQAFVERAFGGDSKQLATAMTEEITRQFEANLDRLGWMDATTRERARAKLRKLTFQIGYPDKWRVYDFAVADKQYATNVLAADTFELRRQLAKVGKPLDRSEWAMTPPTVNAYYDPSRNDMHFPAGILQPPFFSADAAVAVNLGAIGMVIGHELTHGYDDQGATFDGDGNMSNWWEPAIEARFKAKTACLAHQYDGYEALPGLHVNGKLTLGENIADQGGLKLAFAAYRKLRAGATPTVADGFTEDQQFFLGAAQAWCENVRPEIMRTLVQTNPHSPGQFRINGPMSDLPAFAEAFSCPAGAPMNPKDRCEVW